MANLTYLDFAVDEVQYMSQAYSAGLRYNAMVSQAQRICECYMKHLITLRLCNNTEVMRSHNLREIYDYLEKIGVNMEPIRTEVMLLNNFYTHTRYPGRDAFLAKDADITASVAAIGKIAKYLTGMF